MKIANDEIGPLSESAFNLLIADVTLTSILHWNLQTFFLAINITADEERDPNFIFLEKLQLRRLHILFPSEYFISTQATSNPV